MPDRAARIPAHSSATSAAPGNLPDMPTMAMSVPAAMLSMPAGALGVRWVTAASSLPCGPGAAPPAAPIRAGSKQVLGGFGTGVGVLKRRSELGDGGMTEQRRRCYGDVEFLLDGVDHCHADQGVSSQVEEGVV